MSAGVASLDREERLTSGRGPVARLRAADRPTLLAALAAAVLVLLILSPSLDGRVPGDPSLVAGDARLARCAASPDEVQFAFPMAHARDYPRFVPGLGDVSELQLDAPALVVVYAGRNPFGGSAAASATSAADAHLRDLCIYVGPAGSGELNVYSRVSTAGMRAVPDGALLDPAAQP